MKVVYNHDLVYQNVSLKICFSSNEDVPYSEINPFNQLRTLTTIS